MEAWNALGAHEFEIEGVWHESKPIYTQENFMVLLNAMDALGGLHNIVNSSGEITEASASSSNTHVQRVAQQLISIREATFRARSESDSATVLQNEARRVGVLGAMTLAGGSITDHVLYAAKASWTSCIKVIGLWSDTADTYTLAFEDEDNVALTGLPASWAVVVAAGEVTWLHGAKGKASADDKDLELTITGGAGVEKLFLIYETWEET